MAFGTPAQKMDLFRGSAERVHIQCCNFLSSTPDLETQSQAGHRFSRINKPVTFELREEEEQEDAVMVPVTYKHCHIHNHFKDMSLVDNFIEMEDSPILNSTVTVDDTMELDETLYESTEDYDSNVDLSEEAFKQPGRVSFRCNEVDSRDSGIASHDSGEGLLDSISQSSSHKGDLLEARLKSEEGVLWPTLPKFSSPRSLSLCGKERIDFLSLLAKHGIADYVLKMLEPSDLIAVTKVSKEWRIICREHRDTFRRVRSHVEERRKNKENLSPPPSSLEEKFETPPVPGTSYLSAPLSAPARVGLREIHNIGNCVVKHAAPKSQSPPTSPTKRRFLHFVRAGAQLPKGKTLLPCPRCSLPSQVDNDTHSGLCTREGCKFHYCTKCKCQFHGNEQCSISPISSQGARKRPATIGSAKSKKNLRRL
ncbi:hypothetical protein C0J52_15301 [Blattella germanica]|nr:hypothetical protein C0J52_15301 [Blattella germanica]